MQTFLRIATVLILALLTGGFSRPAAAQPSALACDGTPGVYLYDGPDYSGRCLRFVNNIAGLNDLDFDNAASSIALIGEWTATLYRDQNYAGNSSAFINNDSDLADNRVGSDQTSSLRVRRGRLDPALACDGGEGVYLYDAPEYRGRCLKLTLDEPDLRRYAFDDLAASLRLVGDWEATLFRDLAYTGDSTLVVQSIPDLAASPLGARQVSSIQIRPVFVPPGFACDGGPGIYLYQYAGYEGRCLKFTTSIPDLRDYFFNDITSSVRRVGAYNATLYQDFAFSGVSAEVLGDDPSLANDAVGDNQVSSLQVYQVEGPPGFTCDGGPGIYLYENSDYGGRCLKFTADIADLRVFDFNDLASSLRPVGGYTTILYRDFAFTGPAEAFSRSDPFLADDAIGDNQVSSLQVQPPIAPPSLECNGEPGVYLYENTGYEGRCLKFTVDTSDLRAYAFDDAVSSIRIVGGYAATLYRDLNFTGIAGAFDGSDANLTDSSIGDNQATSLQVRRSNLPEAFVCEGQGVYLYQDPQYQGPCRKFINNTPNLELYDFDNVASSIQVVGPYSVRLYRDQAFRGPWSGFQKDDPNLADDIIGDNQVTSLRIQRR